ncbi:PIN domain-containing protein [Chryseobacterium arthrosphaerae]|uniref:PIN domain-containing protein n=1 Tax=Chryseobacterium arthrosphaerae TaxID=651561 RepID=UPI003D32D178
MNIFLDSNILFRDYFFQHKSNKAILDYCKEGLVNIYMSEVVRLELRKQFQNEIEAKNIEIRKLKKDAVRLKLDDKITEISVDSQLNKFDKFYKNLDQDDNYSILDYQNDFLPDIVDRAINRIKPFTENKSEFKDALIWKTYSEYVESNDIQDCILLTNNTSDFCSKKNKSQVHPDLQKDSARFAVINQSFEFLKLHGSKIESPENKFLKYIALIEVNEEFVREMIIKNFENIIQDRIHKEIDALHPNDILSKDYFLDGQLVPFGCEILDCEDIEYEVIGERALISGIVNASTEVEVWEYNSARDPGEDQYSTVAERNVIYKIHFNFDMRMEEKSSDFEMTDVALNTIN